MTSIAKQMLFCALAVLAGLGTAPAASPPDKPYQPPVGQRMVQGVWNGVEYIYEGDWVPDFIYKRDPKNRDPDDPNAFQAPGDWRDESRPGYRARPTPKSVEFYQYVMEKAGRGEEISPAEAMVIQRMIENRTWPEAPDIADQDRAAAEWANRQSDSEDSSFLTDPVGWTRRKNADLIYEQLTRAGRTDQDTPPSEGIEKFRKYWQSKTPEEKQNLPLGQWMKNYLVRKGYDMRSDEERADDEAWEKEAEEKAQRAREALEEAERQKTEELERKAQRQQDWFKKMWEEEDRRIAQREARERLEEAIRRSKEDPEEAGETEPTEDDQERPEGSDSSPDDESVSEPDSPGDEPAAEVETEEEDIPPDDESPEPEEPEEPESPAEEPEAETSGDAENTGEEDRTDSRSGGEETATDEPGVTDDAAEDEPDDIPESDDSSEPDETDAPAPDSSSGENTITKGYVEGKDGSRITLTETRDADGNLTRVTETETDADGNVISQTTYEGGTGEGKTTPGAPDLRDAEPPSDADVDIGMATGGFKTADDFSSQWTGDQEQRGTDSSLTMAQNTQMEESSNIGNQQIRDARITKDAGGRDARNIRDDSTRNVNKADRENSWGKAIGDAVESGITEGGKAFGQAMGQGAADRVVGDIFGSDEDDSDSSSSGGASASPAPSASAAAPASRSSGSGGKKPSAQTKPSSSSKPSGGAGSAGSTASSDSASSSAPKPETTSSSSAPLVGHCPLCGRTDLVEHVYDTGNMTVHDWRCPVCNVTGRPGPPPPGLGSSSATAASPSPSPASSTASTPATQPPRDWWLVCARCKHYPCGKQPPGPGDDVLYWIVCPKCGWKIGMSNSGQ